jgi:AmmeMemoRadiSam system protein A
MQISQQQAQLLLGLARRAIRRALAGAPVEDVTPEDPALHAPAGCFCSLHTNGSHFLRGCVGMVEAKSPLYRAVQDAARSVLRDPRFASLPVRSEELPRLTIELSILSPMTPAKNALDFDLLNDGIYLSLGGDAGLFLPQVARETGWTKEQLLERLCSEKLGVHADAWRGPHAVLMKFTALIIGPERF